MPGIERKVPDIFVCPITHELLKEPVMCEDRRVYERQAITQFFERQVIKKSPINRTLIFKNAYPLLWPYTQRQQQVQQFKQKNPLLLNATPSAVI